MKKIRINNFKEHLYHETLENGLNIYILPLTNKNNYSCMYVTKYGGKDIKFKKGNKEYKVPTGIAHFLEHKVFERKEDPFDFYGKSGTDVNAFTSNDHTCYYFLGNKNFNRGLKYLLNWLKDLNITEEQVQKEQGIILEESSMYKDNPDRVLYNKIRENIFINEPSKYKVIGTDEDIVKITKQDLDLCFNTFYKPNNMYLLISGNINPQKTIKTIKEELKQVTPDNSKVEKLYDEEPDEVAKEYEEIKMNVEIPKVAIGYKIPKSLFKDLDIKQIELDIYLHGLLNISLGPTSEIREKWLKENLFTTSYYRITEIKSHYIIELYATSSKEQELIKSLEEYVKDLKIDEESFKREKKLWIAHEIKALDSPLSALYSVLDDLLDYGEYINNKIEIINNLNYKTLKKVKEKINFENKTIVKIIPNR